MQYINSPKFFLAVNYNSYFQHVASEHHTVNLTKIVIFVSEGAQESAQQNKCK